MTRTSRIDAKAAATVMVTGSAAFLAGAFMPVSRVYPEREARRKLAILMASPLQWRVQQRLLAAGTAALPVGVVMLARTWDEENGQPGRERRAGREFVRGAGAAMAAGSIPFLVHLAARSRDPEAFALGRLPGWPFASFTWLHLAGMAALGTGLLTRTRGTGGAQAGPSAPQWPGWLNVGGAAVFGSALAATGDLPPLLIYSVELATGVAVIRQERATAARTPGG